MQARGRLVGPPHFVVQYEQVTQASPSAKRQLNNSAGNGDHPVDERPKKVSRDLSALKARLGLEQKPSTSETASPPSPGAPVVPPSIVPPGTAPKPVSVRPPEAAVPTPGVGVAVTQVPPASAPPTAPAAQPVAEARRDPFSAMSGRPLTQPIMDAGPQLDIPMPRRGRAGTLIAVGLAGLLAAGVGWSFGRVYSARLVFNRTVDDAKLLLNDLQPMVKLNQEIHSALKTSAATNRGKKRLQYDVKLLDALQELLQRASLKETQKKQERLFRTNYARMTDVTVQKLFEYYNDTLRLYAAMQFFADGARRDRKSIERYQKGVAAQRNYGIIFGADKGSYYLGRVVEVGQPQCKGNKRQCKASQLVGFKVRVGNSEKWVIRPAKSRRISEIVIPIDPQDQQWAEVTQGKPGYLAYRRYAARFADLLRVCAKLALTEKDLTLNLRKQAKREKLFAPI